MPHTSRYVQEERSNHPATHVLFSFNQELDKVIWEESRNEGLTVD